MGHYYESHGPVEAVRGRQGCGRGQNPNHDRCFSLCGEGLCIGYDSGDAVSSEYKSNVQFSGGTIAKVIFDVADDAYFDVERHMAAAMARD